MDGFVLQRSRIGQLLADEGALEVVHESGALRQFMSWLSKADRGRWPHLLSFGVPADATDRPPLRAVSALRRAGIRILLVAPPSSRANSRTLMDSGADGIVSTSDGEAEFLAAATTVLAGAPFVSAHAQSMIDGTQRAARLSAQEERVLTLYASGMTVAEAAAAIGVRHDTARKYLNRVRDKYTAAGRPARTKLELARIAWAEGLIVTELPAASEAG
ncbi:helix-turn-helix transcriptional regulator [Microbacterium tumbae]